MTRFRKFLVVCAAIFAALYVAYVVIFPTVYLRYRLTLDVDVDGVTHSGSGVVEITYRGMPDWLGGVGGGAHFGGDMRGYAITVDLRARGLLFVLNAWPDNALPYQFEAGAGARQRLLVGANLAMLPFVAYGLSDSQVPSTGIAAARELRGKNGPVDLPLDKLPLIVRFTDINDRGTFQPLDPNDLSAAYGPGVRLVRARFEFTTDPVSPMPQSWPKWLVAANDSTYQGTPRKLAEFPAMPWFKAR
jgi:hypothetical protein